jgi:Na+-translocating ferredoxin:NAD+ oxidoreductase RnfD subunit
MNRVLVAHSQPLKALNRFAKTPKSIVLLILVLLAIVAMPFGDSTQIFEFVAVAVTAAVVLDMGLVWLTSDTIELPDGAIITGLIVALVLRSQEPLWVPAAAAAIAIASKHLLRTRWSNVFNPAAVGLVAASLLFGSGQSWWGALPVLGPLAVLVLLPLGLFIADRINKLPLILAYLGVFFAIFVLASFVSPPARVAEVFRTPDLQAAIFFACLMVDDPPTCPVRYEDQLVFGAIVALASAFFLLVIGGVYYLAAGLLIANGWESLRRVAIHMTSATGAFGGQLRSTIGTQNSAKALPKDFPHLGSRWLR